jgi:hypothetical protein
VNPCSIGLTHPAVCTRARVPLTCGHVHRPPLYPISSKRVPINWALIVYLNWCGPEKLWRPTPKNSDPPWGTPPPHTSADRTHTFTNRKISTSGSDYPILNRFDTYRPKATQISASCTGCKKCWDLLSSVCKTWAPVLAVQQKWYVTLSLLLYICVSRNLGNITRLLHLTMQTEKN